MKPNAPSSRPPGDGDNNSSKTTNMAGSEYDTSTSFCTEGHTCMARAEEAKFVDPRGCRDWFVRAARCFTLAAECVSDVEIRVSLALLARSMVVNAMTFGQRSALGPRPYNETAQYARSEDEGGYISNNQASSPPTVTARKAAGASSDDDAVAGGDIIPTVTRYRLDTAGVSRDRVSGMSKIPRGGSSVNPAQALLQLEEELVKLGIMEAALVSPHHPAAASSSSLSEAGRGRGGNNNTIADSYLFLSSLQHNEETAPVTKASVAVGGAASPPPVAAAPTRPVITVSAAANKVAAAAAVVMPTAISGLAAPATEWISGWIHNKRTPELHKYSEQRGNIQITDGGRVSSELQDYTLVDNAEGISSGGSGRSDLAFDPTQSVHLLYSKDGAPPPPPPQLTSAASRDRVIAEQNLIRMSETIQRLADENASLARKVEELQSVGAHCSRVRTEMRAFIQEYEGRFSEFKDYLKQHKGEINLPDMSPKEEVAFSVDANDASTSTAAAAAATALKESETSPGVNDDAAKAEVDRLQKIIVALLNDMKKTKSKLSKQEKVLAKHNLLSEVERVATDATSQHRERPPSTRSGTRSDGPLHDVSDQGAPEGLSKPPLSQHRSSASGVTSVSAATATAGVGPYVASSSAQSPPSSGLPPPLPVPSLQRGRSIDTLTGGMMVPGAFNPRNPPPLSPAATTMRDSLQRQLKSHYQQQQQVQQQVQQQPKTAVPGQGGASKSRG